MYGELYQYLVLHKKLNLPGIGTFSAERKPAEIDIASKQISAPYSVIALHKDNAPPSKKLFGWLAAALNLSELDAVVQFNNFVFDLRNKLSAGNQLQWASVGTLSKGLSGEIIFEPVLHNPVESPVAANKVIRHKSEHSVTVGEYERSSDEMREFLGRARKKISNWWAIALIVIIASVIFLGFYFSAHGINVSSTGNQQKVILQGK